MRSSEIAIYHGKSAPTKYSLDGISSLYQIMVLTGDPDPNTPLTGSRQTPLIILQIFLVSIALIIYALRVYARAFLLRSVSSDDYVMGLAMLSSIGLAINACLSTQYGWGLHFTEIPKQNNSALLRFVWTSELLFTISTSLAKLSILLFYLRIAVTRLYRQVIYASVAFIIVWGVTFTFVVIFQCHPVSAYWDLTSTQCYNPDVAFFIHGLTNSITDIYVYVLPMRMVWALQLPKQQRIGLLAIFAAGFLVCVAGALRLYYSITTQKSHDTPWVGFNLYLWESIEINLGIICASAPCLKALVTKLLPRLFPSQNSKSGYTLNSLNNPSRHTIGGGRILKGRSDSQDGLYPNTFEFRKPGYRVDIESN